MDETRTQIPPLAGPSDGALLERLARGDGSALAPLVERYQGALLRHARALMGDESAHHDVVQETFLKLLERPPTLPDAVRGDAAVESAHLASWLHKVTRNGCMDTLRGEKRRRQREESVASHEAALDSQAGGAGLVEARDTRAAVERGLASLNPDQREVLVLRLISGRSYKEIAEITGRKIGTVGWLISEGLSALADKLGPLLDVDAVQRPTARSGEMR
jgi:RNA polymerase sigma-70 factor (ECF subfamily)